MSCSAILETNYGDLNSSDIRWSSLHGSTPFSVSMWDLAFKYSLEQVIKSFIDTQGNISYVLIINVEELVRIVVNKENLSSLYSDHCLKLRFMLRLHLDHFIRLKLGTCTSLTTIELALIAYLLDADFSKCFTSPVERRHCTGERKM